MARSDGPASARSSSATKQYLAAIRPYGVSPSTCDGDVDHAVRRRVVDPGDVDLSFELPSADSKNARWPPPDRIVGGPFEPSKYRGTYTDELHELIRRTAAGDDVEIEQQPAPTPAAMDLMAALEQSVDAVKKRRTSRPTAQRQPEATEPVDESGNGRPKKPRAT
jgi:hypothetical protein